MPKKKNQLKSGNYRVQAYDYTDSDGKKHYRSFTAPSRKLAEMKASEWKINKGSEVQTAENLTVYDAVKRYIELKKGVLSPSTYREYISSLNNHFKGVLGRMKVSEVKSQDAQLWVSDLSSHLAPHTVRDQYSLFKSAMDMFAPDTRIKVTLPAKKKPDLYCPSDKDIEVLLASIKGTELEIAVLLGAFGTLRRGEICALESTDIQGSLITISKSMVKSSDNQWVIKQPKTYSSYRTVEMPQFVIDRISDIEGRIVRATPDQVSNQFHRALKKTDLPSFRFHDLRHYSASIMHAIGVPDQYIMARGGWNSDAVLKDTYRDVIDIESARQTKKIIKHFEKVSHEISHAGL